MSFANINDAAAIQALLDQLKSSEVWQRVTTAGAAATPSQTTGGTPHEITHTDPSSKDAPNVSSPPHGSRQAALGPLRPLTSEETSKPPSVAALLSQLQAARDPKAAVGPSRTAAPTNMQPTMISASSEGLTAHAGPDAADTGTSSDGTLPRVPHTPRQDLRACTFHQALPHLARLAEDRDFLKALTAMRSEQAELERQLCQERKDIQRKHEERVQAARTKASIIGAGLTRYEADALTESFRAELAKFDRERVLVAWDGLVTKQQAAFEALGVPAMFPSTRLPDRERQEKIMQVLNGIVGNEGSSPALRSTDG